MRIDNRFAETCTRHEAAKLPDGIATVHGWKDILRFTVGLRSFEQLVMKTLRYEAGGHSDVVPLVCGANTKVPTLAKHARCLAKKGSRVRNVLDDAITEYEVYARVIERPARRVQRAVFRQRGVGSGLRIYVDADHGRDFVGHDADLSPERDGILQKSSAAAAEIDDNGLPCQKRLNLRIEQDSAVKIGESTNQRFRVILPLSRFYLRELRQCMNFFRLDNLSHVDSSCFLNSLEECF